MCGLVASIVILIIGGILVIGTNLVGFLAIPALIKSEVTDQVILKNDTAQMDRFKEVPFVLNMKVRMFSISNPEETLNGGVPIVTEVGPYVYRLYQSRNISEFEEDTVTYRRLEYFEFDAEAIIQIAEQSYPQLLGILDSALEQVFREHNKPITTYRVGDVIKDGVPFCTNPRLVGLIACAAIRLIGQDSQNIAERPDRSLEFSAIGYRQGIPSPEYKVVRGFNDVADLGRIIELDQMPHFEQWTNIQHESNATKTSVCNMINGTDSGIFAPFVDRKEKIYAVNTDICRSIELRYEYDSEVLGVPTARFAAKEWLLDNDDGCFCINVTTGINRENGCLFRGAMEIQSCVGAPLVLTNPHFLYADPIYRSNIFGMMPVEDDHRIYIDIETNTGTPLRGAKRGQFNIFMRSVEGITGTQTLRTSLTPFLWVEESFILPEKLADELKSSLLNTLRIIDIVVPVVIAISCVILVVGLVLTVLNVRKKSTVPTTITAVPPAAR
ncbi:hypothetical protein K1T71_000108 [Dendrolimus kikuchii]|uniref:Uncharacterized protein n=1 Tax=Dendrolimus kikuchii TaxID=765133 RepID=A0ACC1DIR8_9NEOP|nr:hypothetical protein K1T71_000108 [Dendrolimus kikuchii]